MHQRTHSTLLQPHDNPRRSYCDINMFNLAAVCHPSFRTQYLAEDCQLLTDIGRRSLQSADVLTCVRERMFTIPRHPHTHSAPTYQISTQSYNVQQS